MNYRDTYIYEATHENITVIIEPACFEYELKTGDKLRVEGMSEIEGKFEIEEEEEDLIVIWQWSGSTIKIFLNETQDIDFNTPVPSLTNGMTPKDFVINVFGGTKSNFRSKKWWEFWKN